MNKTIQVTRTMTGVVVIFLCANAFRSNFAENGNKKEGFHEYIIQIPLGLISPTFPTGLPPLQEEVALGEELFQDKVLSQDSSVSCATCHIPRFGFTDRLPVSRGIGGAQGRHNAPTVLNVAFFESFSWNGRHASLEEQAVEALSNPKEMGLDLSKVGQRLERKYGARLRRLYGEVSTLAVAKVLGAYQRTLIAGDSPFDHYMFKKDENAISESAKRGFKIFLRQGRCIQCHVIRCEECHPFGGASAFFTNNRFHNLGVGFDKPDSLIDWGRAEVTGKPEDKGAFKTPTLRNVALTAPYMHDGSLATLDDVIEHYNKGGIPNPYLDPEIRPLHLSEREKKDLVEFLKSLTTISLLKEIEIE
jgi:cytochrome c peroxidase